MDEQLETLLRIENENRGRLIHVEGKLNRLLDLSSSASFVGHPDQAFGGRTYAQHGDDVIVACIFHSLGIAKPSYLDIGAHHPFNISNTALFHERGSRGINVEPNPQLFKAFELARPEDVNLNVGVAPAAGVLDFYVIDDRSGRNTFDKATAEAFVSKYPSFRIQRVDKIPVVTINDIVRNHAGGVFPDFLSIDVEGLDGSILNSADFSASRPKVICVEVENAVGRAAETGIAVQLVSRGYFCAFKAISNLIFVDEAFRDKVS